MHPVFALWIGLLVVYLVVTGRAEQVIAAWQDILQGKLKGGGK